MDGSEALKDAAEIVYLLTPTILCTWHVNKCVLAKCKKHFTTNEEWDLFFIAWQQLIQSPTPDQFEER